MITTIEITPPPVLAPYIKCYAYRTFDTHGVDVIKPWYASCETYIPFFFQDLPVKLVSAETGEILKTGRNCGVVGLSDQFNGLMTFNGSYSFLQIIFNPNGFYKLFAIPQSHIANQIIWGEDILNKEIERLQWRLSETTDIMEMVKIASYWLIGHLKRRRITDFQNRILAAADLMTKSAGLVDVGAAASYINMSPRNFERQFNNEVGLPPKLFCCVARFNHALELKLRRPDISWTSVAYHSGYFDQMHLVKDFKKFCGYTPSLLINQTPLLEDHMMENSFTG